MVGVAMIGQFLIVFREALEAALIIGIVVAYLERVERRDLFRYLYLGTAGAVISSLVLAWSVQWLFGELTGTSRSLFEGVSSLTAAAVLTYMIFWMSRQAQRIRGDLQKKVDLIITSGQTLGIALLAFTAVFREGVETILFLTTLFTQDPSGTIVGAAVGLAVVMTLAFLLIKRMYRLDIRRFFRITSVLLIVFAAGLTGYGVHELIEADMLPAIIEQVWDINPPLNPDGSYPLLHEKGVVGSILKTLIGYDGDPELLRVIAYIGYWIVIGVVMRRLPS
ncbi:MAG: hypothetical protein GTO23_11060 [Nitrososphaeria archaeon]|nr:hypothetical protein [Nitrososphaeria archaeon]